MCELSRQSVYQLESLMKRSSQILNHRHVRSHVTALCWTGLPRKSDVNLNGLPGKIKVK